MGTTNIDKKKILKAVQRNIKKLKKGYVHKGSRWLVGPSVPAGAYFVKDLKKGMNSKSYIICKPKSKKIDYNNIEAWKWYH